MRAGKLDRLIRVERPSYQDDGHGGLDPVWAKVADIRAQIVQSSTEEFIRSYGVSDETVIIFRTRFINGVTPEDRIEYGGGEYDIKEVKEIGRREGLEIRCVRRPS